MFHQKFTVPRGIEFEYKFKTPGAGADIPTLEEMKFFELSSLVF